MAEPLLRLAVVVLLLRLSSATTVTSGTTSDTASTPSESATKFGHLFGQQRPAKRPHIVVILADDLGWNDVSFHGSNQIPTPNIDALAYNGVILNSHYVSPMCTPSRATLMTGKYPIHTGMQHSVLIETEPRGLPLDLKLMPQFLREAGYKTHMVGKWHLGFFRHEYTPTYRGFDSHYGYWHGYQDYWSHDVVSSREEYRGYDMRSNMSVAWDARGKYSTDLFTEEAVRLIDCHDAKAPMFLYLPHLAPHAGNTEDPYQAPAEEIAKFAHIDDPERRTYAAMVSKLDSSVGEVVAALRRRGMLDNSVILFMADNGAPTMGIHNNRGSNYPLRGIKDSAWEGAVRGVAAIWSPLIKKPRRVSNQLFSIADWLPTFWSLAGKNIADLGPIDGVNIWEALTEDKPSPRTEVLINIDAIDNYAAIRRGDYKYVVGHTSSGDDWYGDPGRLGHKDADAAASEAYPRLILASRVSAEIAMQNSATKRGNYSRAAKILSADEIQRLRREAIVRCNVKKEQQVVCNPIAAPCLFNIREDPCEKVNLAAARPAMVATLEAEVRRYRRTAIPEPNISAGDPLSNPALWDGIWVNWRDPDPTIFSRSSPFPSTDGPRSSVSAATA